MQDNQTIESIIKDFASGKRIDQSARLKVGEFLKTHTFIFDLFDEQMRRVVELRCGIYDDRGWTLEEVGSDIGCTKEHVRQVERRVFIELSRPQRINLLMQYDDTTFDKALFDDFKSLLCQDIVTKIPDESIDFLQDVPISALKFRYLGLYNWDVVENVKKTLYGKQIFNCKDLIINLQQDNFIDDLQLTDLLYRCLVHAICDLAYGKSANKQSKEVFARRKVVKIEREKLKRAEQATKSEQERVAKQIEKQQRLKASNQNPEKVMIEDFGFDRIIYHALQREGINTLADLIKYCAIKGDIKSIRLVGEYKESVILERLASLEIDLNEKVNDYRNKYFKDPEMTVIEMLNLSKAVYNALKRAGINTVGQLVDFYVSHQNGFRHIRRLGTDSEEEIIQRLTEYGIKLPSKEVEQKM